MSNIHVNKVMVDGIPFTGNNISIIDGEVIVDGESKNNIALSSNHAKYSKGKKEIICKEFASRFMAGELLESLRLRFAISVTNKEQDALLKLAGYEPSEAREVRKSNRVCKSSSKTRALAKYRLICKDYLADYINGMLVRDLMLKYRVAGDSDTVELILSFAGVTLKGAKLQRGLDRKNIKIEFAKKCVELLPLPFMKTEKVLESAGMEGAKRRTDLIVSACNILGADYSELKAKSKRATIELINMLIIGYSNLGRSCNVISSLLNLTITTDRVKSAYDSIGASEVPLFFKDITKRQRAENIRKVISESREPLVEDLDELQLSIAEICKKYGIVKQGDLRRICEKIDYNYAGRLVDFRTLSASRRYYKGRHIAPPEPKPTVQQVEPTPHINQLWKPTSVSQQRL